jgi:poly(3-hydroxyoctanoate) depolymerase
MMVPFPSAFTWYYYVSKFFDVKKGTNMRTIKIDGMSFPVVERQGSGDAPLLLINGMRMECGVFNKFKRNIASPTISFNFPTWWTCPSWRWSISPMSDIAHKVARLVAAAGYEQVDVLGVSWGGALAIELATLHPSLCRKLILVSTTARPSRMWRPKQLHSYLTKDYGGNVATDRLLMAEAKDTAGSSPLLTDLYRGLALPFWWGTARLPFIRQQTLIVSGTDDRITSVDEAKHLHHHIAASELELVKDTGHLLIYSDPKKVADPVNVFCATPSR